MAGGRMRRVDEAVREVLGDAISKEVKDPRVGFVTVTAVKTSPDLRHARVYVSVLGEEPERVATLEGLRSAHGFLQGVIASQLSLKRTPMLAFEYDQSVARAARLNELMKADPAPPDEEDRSGG
jgi:ribosome-binding factor A